MAASATLDQLTDPPALSLLTMCSLQLSLASDVLPAGDIQLLPRDLLHKIFTACAGRNGTVLLGLAGISRVFRDCAFEVRTDSNNAFDNTLTSVARGSTAFLPGFERSAGARPTTCSSQILATFKDLCVLPLLC